MATYLIELSNGMTYSVEAAQPPQIESAGIAIRDYAGSLVVMVAHGTTIIRKDAIAKPSVDELQAARDEGYRMAGGNRGYPVRERGPFDTMGSGQAQAQPGPDTYGVTEPGEGPIQPTPPLSAYEEPGAPAAHEDEYR